MAESTEQNVSSEEAKSPTLSSLKLAQLQSLASQLGITGARRMRKSALVDAITAHQRGSSVSDKADEPVAEEQVEKKPARTRTRKKVASEQESAEAPASEATEADASDEEEKKPARRRNRRASSASVAEKKSEVAEGSEAETAED